jgi:phosphoribosyl-AMP cyclohydrolase
LGRGLKEKTLTGKWTNLPAELALAAGQFIPAVIQDAASGAVLMLVRLDREALQKIAATGRVHYFHPEKRKVVAKGEASGHFQEVAEIRLACTGEALILKVQPRGGACEKGYHSCFFRKLTPQGWETADPQTFNPEETYPEFAFSH